MSSFERFKRDVRSRNSSQVRSSVRRSTQQKDPKVQNLFNFSSPTINFMLDRKQFSSFFNLKITNQTGYRIHFKIRSNNAKDYIVNPFEEVVADQQTLNVAFQFVKPPQFSIRNAKDKFEIMWGKVSYNPDEPSTLSESRIFQVLFEETDDDDNQFLKELESDKFLASKNYNYNTEMSQADFPSGKNLAESFGAKNYETLLTKNNLIIISVVSFVLGFIFT